MTTRQLSRRQCLVGAAGLVIGPWARCQSPSLDHGRVNPPLLMPDLPVTRHDDLKTTLRAVTADRVTALHQMFTRCPSTCPIQAAIFQQVQAMLGSAHPHVQLVSVSIDPQQDTVDTLAGWLKSVGAGPRWLALRPRMVDLPALRAAVGARAAPSDNHSTQVSIIDRNSRVVWRSIELPAAEEISDVLSRA